MKRQTRWLPALLVWISAAAIAQADVRLPSVIGDHMVLQQDKPLPIWGWADPGEDVTVTLGASKASAKADQRGAWRVTLAPVQASDNPVEMTIAGKNTVKVTDILIGEVWVGSGQSNMQWSVQAAKDSEKEIAAADYPNIRLFLVPLVPSGSPASDVNARWVVCTPETISSFSAVLYYFGRTLHSELKQPVGLIATSWGGTRIEPWIPPAGFASQPELKQALANLENSKRGYSELLETKIDELERWVHTARAAKAASTPIPAPPAIPNHPLNSNGAPTGLYNGMVHALVPLAIRGATWYQGESNVGMGMQYHVHMKALIAGWRRVWDQDDFPFLFVQLAPYSYGGNTTRLPEIWEAQTATLSVPNTGMAVIHDIGNTRNIHPTNKQEVGRRLALWALAKTYGHKDLEYSGPLFESIEVVIDDAELTFKHARGLKSSDRKSLNWFTIAGKDKKFYPSEATISGDRVLVRSSKVSQPVAVRFAWHQLAEPNLVNAAGLPASPFRTDNWSDNAIPDSP
jgi:sialate O-acetylesterase